MFINTGIHLVLLAYCMKLNVASSIIEFNAPQLIRKNEIYKLVINNPSPHSKFPVDNFAFTFELLLNRTPRLELSIADVSSLTYTGEDYRGFSIKDFVIKKDLIEMNIEFRREAHGTWFRVRYSAAQTEAEKEKFYISNPDMGIILEREIDMYLPYTITIQVGPEVREVAPGDRDTIGHVLLADKSGQISCEATDGLPNSLPQFVNSDILRGAIVTAVNRDVTKLTWTVRKQDHGKQIQCRAGQQINNVTLNVYHYMTGVKTHPIIDTKVARGSQLKCMSTDGYPLPTTEWIFVSGPKDSTKYYEFRDNNITLLINATANLHSNWTFECRGSNSIPAAVVKYLATTPPIYPIKHVYNFTIVESLDSNVQSSSAGVIVVVFLLVIIIITGVVVAVIKRDKIQEFITNYKSGPGQPTKIAQKKSTDPGYKYTDIRTAEAPHNGSPDKVDTTYYNEDMVGTAQPKSTNALGPIHRV